MRALVINCSPVRSGATACIAGIVAGALSGKHEVKCVCIDDYRFDFCKGCRSCHGTARCVLRDGVDTLIEEFERADTVVCVSPSYWADVPGQFKAFIDRCTPWCNTHEPHARLSSGKVGYAIALRTGPGLPECERILATIRHFYGHLEIEYRAGLALTGVKYREDVENRREEILAFCEQI